MTGNLPLYAGVLLVAWLIGAVPSAYIVARVLAGVDIRTLGDGNVGARNAFHSVGPLAGVIAGVADIGKGMLAVEFAQMAASSGEIAMLAGMAAVLGHDFSPFLRFQGGQGMAAMIGAFLVLFPVPAIVAIAVFLVVWGAFRNWDAAWTVAFPVLIILTIVSGYGWNRVVFTVLLIPTIGLRKILQRIVARRKVRPGVEI